MHILKKRLTLSQDKIERIQHDLKDRNNLKEKKEHIDLLSGQIIESVKKNKISKVETSIISQVEKINGFFIE